MRIKFCLVVLLILPLIGVSQSNDTITEEVFTVVKKMPKFKGGKEKLFEYISSNIKYPIDAKENNVTGIVFVQFIIGKDGKVYNTEVKRGVHELLDKEALRVVNSMPLWKPGKQRGEFKNVSYILPIKFKLD